MCCQLEAFGSCPDYPRIFFPSYFLAFRQACSVSLFAESNENQSLLCKPSWSSRAMFGHKSGGSCSGSPGGDFSPRRVRQGPLHHVAMKGRIKRLSQSQASSDLPFLNIVHFSKHHCEFAVCLLGHSPSKFYARIYIYMFSFIEPLYINWTTKQIPFLFLNFKFNQFLLNT